MGKYIIEIDDDIVEYMRDEGVCKGDPKKVVRLYQATIADAIKNGTPYNPSGDVVSREALKEDLAKEIKTNDMGLWLKILLVIDNAPAAETFTLEDMQNNFDLGAMSEAGKHDRPEDEYIRKEDVIALLNKWADGYSYIEIPTEDAIKAIMEFNPSSYAENGGK